MASEARAAAVSTSRSQPATGSFRSFQATRQEPRLDADRPGYVRDGQGESRVRGAGLVGRTDERRQGEPASAGELEDADEQCLRAPAFAADEVTESRRAVPSRAPHEAVSCGRSGTGGKGRITQPVRSLCAFSRTPGARTQGVSPSAWRGRRRRVAAARGKLMPPARSTAPSAPAPTVAQ